jgi:hypothetical protein
VEKGREDGVFVMLWMSRKEKTVIPGDDFILEQARRV